MLKIEEAMSLYHASTGQKLTLTSLAKQIWPGLEERSARIKLSRIISGKTKSVEADVIIKICDICKVSPNYLFNYELDNR